MDDPDFVLTPVLTVAVEPPRVGNARRDFAQRKLTVKACNFPMTWPSSSPLFRSNVRELEGAIA